jgi:hypothetical protein
VCLRGAGRSGVRIPGWVRDVSLLENLEAWSGAHPAHSSMGTGVLCEGQSDWGVKLTTHLHLAQGTKVKYEWSYSPDPLHAFTAGTGPALLSFALTVNSYLLPNLKRCDKYEGHRNGPADWQHLGLTGRILICVASCLAGRSVKPFRCQG